MPRYGPTQRVVSKPIPKPKLGPSAAGGAVLARGTFQPSNRRQQTRLHADVVAEANRLETEHQKQKVKATYNRLSYQRELARQRGHGEKVARIDKRLTALQPHIEAAGLTAKPSKFLSSAYGAVRKAEKIPVAGQLIGLADPILLGKTAVANVKELPKIGTSKFGKGQVSAGMVFGRGGEIPRISEAGAIPEEVAAAEKVRESLGPARARRAAQQGLYREEKGKRIGRAQAASERAGGGEAGFAAAKGELRGELPKVKFQNLREGKLSEDDLHTILTQVQNHPDLNYWEKIHAQQGLVDAFREGKTPQPSQLRHFQTVFGQDAAKEIAKTSKLVKAGKITLNVANIPRSLMASFDLSAPFRQGLVAGVSHPRIFFKNFAPMIRAAGSENFYHAVIDEIKNRPNAQLYQRSGLKLTELGREIGQREEQFQSEYAERIPGIGRGVRGSGRAYTAFLDKMRADMFDALMEKARKRGINTEDRTFQRGLSTYINSATGRGSLGPAEPWAPALNAFFFSPRLMASRLNFLDPTWYARLSPFARRQALKSAAKLGAFGGAAGLAGAAAGGKVSLDPRSSNFAKIRFGNTRLDPLGGFSQYAVLAGRLASGKSVSSTTGEVMRLGPGMGQLSRKDIAERFFSGKATPTVSLIYDILQGKNFQGQPLNVKNEIISRVIPLAIQDAYDLERDRKNIPLGVGGYAASGLGIGLQTYGPRQLVSGVQAHGNALPKQILTAAKAAGLKGVQITPELQREIKLYTVRQSAYAKLRQQKGHLTPADRFGADVQLLVENGIATRAQAKEAIDWAAKASPSDLKKARSSISRRYFKFTNLNYAIKVLEDHGQKVKLPSGG